MIHNFNELREHIGHDISCVCYGRDNEEPVNVALECETCGCVLLDYDNPETTEED
jgi:hypothetical protein